MNDKQTQTHLHKQTHLHSQVGSFPANYREKVYAGWLGKCIGVRLGAPVEGWSYETIAANLGEITDYLPLPPGKIFKPDDDTAMPLILIRALEDYGSQPTARELGETWLNYLGDQRGTLWWGGYGVSTEHTAYLNLAAGIPAPLSGSIELNGAAVAEQIGGQIFSDIWGLVIPNNPALAADYAERAASVSHAGDGINGGRFVAALVSQAFVERDPRQLIEAGLAVLPAESEYVRVIRAMVDFYTRNPQDWRAAFQFLYQNFGYDRYPGVVHIIPNAGILAIALLYGAGDFSRSILIANNCGWDTDCNVGNIGAVLGVAVGLEGIEPRWREPMNDLLVAASLTGVRNLTTLPACADRFAGLALQIANQPLPAPGPRFHFTYPGSTQGFEARVAEGRGSFVAMENVAVASNQRVLRAVFKKLNKKGDARIFVHTYLWARDLTANFYGASFSPQIYPGQTLKARVQVPPGSAPLSVGVYVWDANHAQTLQGPLQTLTPGEWYELTYQIPPQKNALLSEAGLVLRNQADDLCNGSLWIDQLDWAGAPAYRDNFALSRPEAGAITQWSFLRGYWRLEGSAYHGSGIGNNETYTGDPAWEDIHLRVRLTPFTGEQHRINIRVQGALRSYALGLAPGGRLVLYKNACGYVEKASVPFDWKPGETVALWIEAKGSCISAGVGSNTLITWEDTEAVYRCGQIGLSNGPGCHTAFEEIEIG